MEGIRFYLYYDPSAIPWDITLFIIQQGGSGMSTFTSELSEEGIFRQNLTLTILFTSEDGRVRFPTNTERQLIRSPGILLIVREGIPIAMLYYNPLDLKYDPQTRQYTLSFQDLIQAIGNYLSRQNWWNVLDAATLLSTLREFVSRFLPSSMANAISYFPDSMSPIQEDPQNPEWPHFAGFIQPASWFVGKEVGIFPLGPWTIINVLGITKSLQHNNIIYVLCAAKPNGWWDFAGDYVWPIITKWEWNPNTYDWDFVNGYFHVEDDLLEDPLSWTYPLWFGLKRCPAGTTGESTLIYTTMIEQNERVVCAWTESSVRKPKLEGDYIRIDDCQLRCVLLNDDLGYLDQRKISLRSLEVGDISDTRIAPQTVILRGGGFMHGTTMAPAGVVFVGLNGIVPYNCRGEGPEGYGESGQDGLIAIRYIRWNDNIFLDSELGDVASPYFVMTDTNPRAEKPLRLLDFEVFPMGDDGLYEIHMIYGRRYENTGNLALDNIVYLVYDFNAVIGDATFRRGDWWRLSYPVSESARPTPCFAVPCGRIVNNRVGFVLGYTLLEHGEGGVEIDDLCFVRADGGILRHDIPYWFPSPAPEWDPPRVINVDPTTDGIMELDIPITAGGEERRDPRKAPFPTWDDVENEQNLASQLRTLIACRIRPFALRYEIDGNIAKVKFHLLHQGFSEYEVFSLSATYNYQIDRANIYTLDGRSLAGELVPKIHGGDYNESDVWRSVVGYPSIFWNRDIRSTGHDHQGEFGVFTLPMGVMTIPVVRKVCENDSIYSEPGRLGYQNMANHPYRYWWNIYNGHRLFIITPLAYWSFVEQDIDYRKGNNIELIKQSWDSTAHGISYVTAGGIWGGMSVNTIFIVLTPRFPLRGDTHTISGENYWELPPAIPSGILDKLEVAMRGQYWDALLLGPQGGALLDNIWWNESEQFSRDLIVSLESLSPQWFGTAYWRGGLYTTLFEYLRGEGTARWGLHEIDLGMYGYNIPILCGAIIPLDILGYLEIQTGDPELSRYRDWEENPIPTYWQIVRISWDMIRNIANITLRGVRDTIWEPSSS